MRTATTAHSFLGAVFFLVWCSVTIGMAQDFRIETDVFLDEEKEPVVETLTIFTNGLVYDFMLTGTEEVTLFDRDRNRLVLMDTERKVKTELTMDSILSFVAQMKAQLSDEQRKFLLSATSDAAIDEEGWLKLANDRVVYRADAP